MEELPEDENLEVEFEELSEETQNEFEQIMTALGNLVGENEIEARRALGDRHYEQTVAYFEAANVLILRKQQAQVNYIQARGLLLTVLSLSLAIAALMGFAWSLYYWFS